MGLSVLIDDAEREEVARRLKSAVIVDNAEENADQCAITLSAGVNIAPPRQGAKIRFLYNGAPLGGIYTVNRVTADLGDGVMEIHGAEYNLNSDLVSAENKTHGGNLLAVVQNIAARFGLDAHIPDVLAKTIPPDATQRGETPLQFLSRLARENNANMTLKSGRLIFLRAGAATGAGGARLPTHEIDAADTENWLSYDITDRITEKIKVQYFAADKTTVAEKIIGDGNILAAHPQIFPDETAAENYAAAAIAKLKPETQTIRADLPIRPDLRAGYPLLVRNLPAGIATEFKIIQISHFFVEKTASKSQLTALFTPFK